jgi:hypothetical protein
MSGEQAVLGGASLGHGEHGGVLLDNGQASGRASAWAISQGASPGCTAHIPRLEVQGARSA